MTQLKQLSAGEILLCCGKGGCPRLKKVSEDKVQITDDDGNTVVMETTQAKLITQAISQLND
jgi:hypothetical protein|tara:strand:- start:128 stop:313 length:186 start_codon:yes stop_codon:yes gene_type:complete